MGTQQDAQNQCRIVGVAVNLLKCDINPINPQLCDMSKSFTQKYCQTPVAPNQLPQMQTDFVKIKNFRK